ncbi:hypothetical protein QL285_067983 [Trifolium repens]|nr:hypothetical protein QL285_067983 [Trifolium repens]
MASYSSILMSFASAILRSIWFGGLKIPNSIRRDLIISLIQRNSIISSIRFALDRCSPRFVSPSVFAEGELC